MDDNMFNLISTKNLYLVELVRVKKVGHNKIWYYNDSKRYILAKKNLFSTIQIFYI